MWCKRAAAPQGYAESGSGTWCDVADTDQPTDREDVGEEHEHPAREQYDHGTDGEQYGATGETRKPSDSELTDEDAA